MRCLGLHGVVPRDTLETPERTCGPVTALGSCHHESRGGVEDELSIAQVDGKGNSLETTPGTGCGFVTEMTGSSALGLDEIYTQSNGANLAEVVGPGHVGRPRLGL